jgi:hypothetical protein
MHLYHAEPARNGRNHSRWVSFLKSLLFRLMVVALSSTASLIVAEALVRVFLPQSLILIRPDIWTPEERIGWKHRPNADTHVNTGEREIRWRTDHQGFRIGETTPDISDLTLVALGDSFLEALQVNYEDTMTAILEQRVSTACHSSLRILNTGVGGWDPNQYRIQLREVLEQRPVDGVLVFAFLGNDIVDKRLDNYYPRQPAQRHFLAIPSSLKWKEWKRAVFYPINDFLEVRSHLFVLLKNRLKFLLMRVGLSAHYFPETLLVEQASADRWEVTASIFEEISNTGRQHGTDTLFVLIPSLAEADPAEGQKLANALGVKLEAVDFDQAHGLLGEELRKRSLTFVDTTPALRAAMREHSSEIYGRLDTHLGKGGHLTVANCIQNAVVELCRACRKVRAAASE